MPRIFDNIDQPLLQALKQTLESSTHADVWVILTSEDGGDSQNVNTSLIKFTVSLPNTTTSQTRN